MVFCRIEFMSNEKKRAPWPVSGYSVCRSINSWMSLASSKLQLSLILTISQSHRVLFFCISLNSLYHDNVLLFSIGVVLR